MMEAAQQQDNADCREQRAGVSPGIKERMAMMEAAQQKDATSAALAARQKAEELSQEVCSMGLSDRKDALSAAAEQDNERAAMRSTLQAQKVRQKSGSTDIHGNHSEWTVVLCEA